MSKITKFAKGQPCTARIPGICTHDPETTVWAHLNSIRWGAGKGFKAHDLCGLIACDACHAVIDGRVKAIEYTKQDVEIMAYQGHMESLNKLAEAGVIE